MKKWIIVILVCAAISFVGIKLQERKPCDICRETCFCKEIDGLNLCSDCKKDYELDKAKYAEFIAGYKGQMSYSDYLGMLETLKYVQNARSSVEDNTFANIQTAVKICLADPSVYTAISTNDYELKYTKTGTTIYRNGDAVDSSDILYANMQMNFGSNFENDNRTKSNIVYYIRINRDGTLSSSVIE